jgi:hypothetical protein
VAPKVGSQWPPSGNFHHNLACTVTPRHTQCHAYARFCDHHANPARPESITLRILVPDTHRPWTFPCRAEDLADEPAFRERAEQISRRHTDALTRPWPSCAEVKYATV